MATFHGFKITGLKSWESMEGIGYSGTLHCGRVRLGTFIDYGCGGPINIEFLHEELDKDIAEQLPHLSEEVYGPEAAGLVDGLETIICHLADLTDSERPLARAWSRAHKKGFDLAIVDTDDGETYQLPIRMGMGDADAEAVIRQAAARGGIGGVRAFKVWREKPVISEGDGELAMGKAALDEHRRQAERDRELRRMVAAARA